MAKEILQLNPTTFKTVFDKYSEVEIGNIEKADFEPHIKLKKWEDECFCKVSLPTTKKIAPLQEDEKIKWIDTDKEVHLYQIENDATVGMENWTNVGSPGNAGASDDSYSLTGSKSKVGIKRKQIICRR